MGGDSEKGSRGLTRASSPATDGRPSEKGYAAGWCIHYDAGKGGGDRPPACRAGVLYETLPKPFRERPCFLDKKGRSRPGAATCESIRRPTPEEMATNDASWKVIMDKTIAGIKAVAPWRKKHRGTNHREVVECAICKGRLHLSITGFNNHVHAKCETPECISWTE